MRPLVIEFEGIDGSGKTTAWTHFIGQLRAGGMRVLDTREVGSPHVPVCVALRKIILDPTAGMDGRAMELVFAAMRLENQKFYASVADKYDVIVSDRGWLSHLAYTDHNVNEQFTQDFYMNVVEKMTLAPDAVIFLEIDPETALKRRGVRNGFVDAIEAKGPEFQVKVYNSFQKYMGILPDDTHIVKIDANQDLEGVKGQIEEQARIVIDEFTRFTKETAEAAL